MIIDPSEALAFIDAIAADRAALASIRHMLRAEGYDDTDPVRGVDAAIADATTEPDGVRVPDSVLESVWIDVRRLFGAPGMSEGLHTAIRRAVDALDAACPGDGPIVPRVVEALAARAHEADRLRHDLAIVNLAVVAAQAPEAATLPERVTALAAERDALRAELDAARAPSVRVGASASQRFKIDQRTGIVAIYDTEHPKYQDTPGCHSGFDWTVCHWRGEYNEEAGHWFLQDEYVKAAARVCALLNGRDA